MNQLETNLVIWAICSILLFEILVIICLCRFCFNRIKPKRFYVKREEFEYLHGINGASSQFQPIILRPPQADELALVGTIRDPNPPITFDTGIPNLGYYRDSIDEETVPTALLHSPPPASHHANWIELRPPAPILTSSNILRTAQLPPADYELRSYPTEEYLYPNQSSSSSPPRPTVVDFHPYRNQYDPEDGDDDDDNDDDMETFQFHSVRHPEAFLSHTQRTDTSTESGPATYSTLIPRSILKGNVSATPPLDHSSTATYYPPPRSQTPSRFDDESPRVSVKVNTDETIPIDFPASAIERTIPLQTFTSTVMQPITVQPAPTRMRFASVSQLNEIEWEIPREFQTIVYDSTDDRQPLRNVLVCSSNENFNNNNNNNNYADYERFSARQRSRSVTSDERPHVSRVFVPWDQSSQVTQPFHLSNQDAQGDSTQQQAFEY